MVENMADEVNAQVPAPRLDALAAAASAQKRGLPPVHTWNPPYCGDIGLKIARDGTWSYQGSPIGRPALVRLFSTILRRESEGYRLVTPVEKVAVEVEDAPFLAIDMRQEGEPAGDRLVFLTNVGDEVAAGQDHPLRFETDPSGGLKPYILIRDDLWALLSRALVYDLVELAQSRSRDGQSEIGVSSQGQFFVMDSAAQGPDAC
jgi:hypothetical protein